MPSPWLRRANDEGRQQYGLGTPREHLRQGGGKERNNRGSSHVTTHSGTVGGNDSLANTGKRKRYDTKKFTPDMHIVLKVMMEPVLACSTPWKLNRLYKDEGLKDIHALPVCHNNCFRCMLGVCKRKDGDDLQFKARPENNHPASV